MPGCDHSHKKLTLEDVLLPKHTKPIRYDIHLTPDLVACTFTGSETIEIEVSAETSTLILHAHELTIVPETVKLSGGPSKVAIEKISYDLTARQQVSLQFDDKIAPGTYKLSCEFKGVLNDQLAGFYRSKDKPFPGKEEWMAVCQFEATDARRCFPCFDEPALKAVFGITVTAPADRTAISNGSVTRVDTSSCGTKKTWHFEDSPVMSSYLVCVVVGRFDHVSQMGKNGVLTSVYVPVGKADLGKFALKVGVEALEFFERKFRVPYFGGKKLDHIAIPDFAAGAMENTGCVTYRQAALMIDESQSSLAMKQRVCQVVCHEISHQWFGNRTTMGWWEGLWLNEGFASFCERLATDAQYPSYQMWPAWTANVHFSAMALDALLSTHPIEVPVATSDDINETFDHISYHKGSCVVRMAYKFLGEANFFKALNAYFEKHAYGNTKTTDLWDAFSAVSGQDAAKVFRNWTLCPGFPFLSVSSGAGGKLKLNSSRFIAPWAINPQAWPKDGDYDAVGPAAFEGLTKHHRDEATKAGIEPPAHETNSWNIPLSVATPKGYESMGVLLLDDDKAKADREGVLGEMADKISAATSGSPWFALNADRGSFFRTVYDEQALEKLSVAAATPADRSSEPALGLMDRIGVVGDAAAASAVGLTPISSVVKLLWAMRYETEYYCWIAMLDALSTLRDSADSISGKLADDTKAFARKLLAPIVEHLGWSPKAGEAPNNALLRAAVLRSAALAGDESVVAECNKRFDAYAVDGGVTSPINADLKQLVYSTVGTYGGTARWEKLLALLKASDSSEEQRRLMTGLGKSADATLLKRCLAMTLEGDLVRSQDVPFIIGAVTSNPGLMARTLCWEWFRNSLPAILAKGWHGGNFVWSSIVGGATSGFDSKERADEITAFFADPAHPVGSAERTVKQNVEAIRNKAWAKHIVSKQSGAISAALAAVMA